MKKILIVFFLLCEMSIMFAGNPVMVIRCRALVPSTPALLFGETCDPDDPTVVTYDGHCFPIPIDGECPSVPGFEYLVPQDVIIDGETVTICVPDCSQITSCESCVTPLEWNASIEACTCDDGISTTGSEDTKENGEIPEDLVICGCPEPLIVNPFSGGSGIISGTGYCTLPEQVCYDLGLDINIAPITCDQPSLLEDTIRIVIKPAPGQRPGDIFTPFVDAVTIEDLENCELLDGTGELIDLVGIFGPADRPAFVADASGCIIVEFLRDPLLETTISFLANDPIVIPACPRVLDPCSCRPENIVDADGIVLQWYDELSYIGNPNSDVTVTANAGNGFLDATFAPFSGVIGTTDGDGLLVVPFFRTPGETTNVTLVDEQGNSTTFMSECTLSVNACANIVPTMGEWGIIVLGLLMMIFSVVAVSQKTALEAR